MYCTFDSSKKFNEPLLWNGQRPSKWVHPKELKLVPETRISSTVFLVTCLGWMESPPPHPQKKNHCSTMLVGSTWLYLSIALDKAWFPRKYILVALDSSSRTFQLTASLLHELKPPPDQGVCFPHANSLTKTHRMLLRCPYGSLSSTHTVY